MCNSVFCVGDPNINVEVFACQAVGEHKIHFASGKLNNQEYVLTWLGGDPGVCEECGGKKYSVDLTETEDGRTLCMDCWGHEFLSYALPKEVEVA